MSLKLSQGHRSMHKMKTPISHPLPVLECPHDVIGFSVYRNHYFQSRALHSNTNFNFDLCPLQVAVPTINYTKIMLSLHSSIIQS